MLLKEEPFCKEEIDLISQLFEVKVKSLTDMEGFEKVIRKVMRPGLVESSPSLFSYFITKWQFKLAYRCLPLQIIAR